MVYDIKMLLIGYRIIFMRLGKKSFILAVCLFLIAFKAMAGNIFIQNAIERAHGQANACLSVQVAQNPSGHDASETKDPIHSMHLMYHVTANVSDALMTVIAPIGLTVSFFSQNDSLKLDNIPESAYKPPRSAA